MKIIKSTLLCSILLAVTAASPAWADRGGYSHGHRYNGWNSGWHGGWYGRSSGWYVDPFPLFLGAALYEATVYPRYRYSTEVIINERPQTVYEERIVSSPSTTWIESSSDQVTPLSVNADTWLYCHQPDGFYPAVKSCNSGWQRISKNAPARNTEQSGDSATRTTSPSQ